MVDANLKIIAELKAFLETISTDSELRKLVTQSASDFSRHRKLTMEHLVALIINMPKRSLSIEIQEFFDQLGKSDVFCTKGAFSLQRTKLKPLFFQVWNKWLVDCFYRFYGDNVKDWKGYRLQAVDGSTAYLMHKEEILEHFGTQDNQYVETPMARVMQVHDILNDITVWGELYPIKTSEQAIMQERVSFLCKNSITLFDRGYPSYSLMYLMLNQEEPRQFVMRCKVSFNNKVKAFMQSKKNSKIVELTPSDTAIATLRQLGYIVTKSTPIKVRMVKIKLNDNTTEVLLTSLYNEELYSLEDLKHLYGLRWRIETTFYKQKNQLQMEQFSGHRVICIRQDYAACIFVSNLQSLLEKQCDDYLKNIESKRKYQYRVNRNVSWASLKHNIVKLFLENNEAELLQCLQRAFERNVEPVRPGRQYERSKRKKRLNGKYQTFTNYKRAI